MDRRFGAYALLTAALASPATARAQDRTEERRLLLVEASKARAAGDHAATLSAAERAHALRPSASLERLMAEELIALGRPLEAHGVATSCVARARVEAPTVNAEIVAVGCQQLREQLLRKLARLSVDSNQPLPAGCAVQLGEGTAFLPCRETLPSTRLAEPGHVRVTLRAPGHEDRIEQVDLLPGTEVSVSLAFEPVSAGSQHVRQPFARPFERPPLAHPKTARVLPSWVGPLVTGLGAAAVVTSGILYVSADQRYRDLKNRCAEKVCATAREEQRSIERLDSFARVAVVSGLALGTAGVVTIVVDWR